MPKQSVPVKLGGKTRHLRFDFYAFEAFEEEVGFSPLDVPRIFGIEFKDLEETDKKVQTEMFLKGLRIKPLTTLVWAGLLHEDNTLDRREVGRWIDPKNMVDVLEKTIEAYLAASADTGDVKNGGSLKGKKKN